jgi:hypothetical protein
VSLYAVCIVSFEADKLRRSEDASNFEFCCQQWDLNRRRPNLVRTQKLEVDVKAASWSLYDTPALNNGMGKPSAVAFSNDLEILRVGSLIYTRDENGYYQIKSKMAPQLNYVEEIASRHHYIALTVRRDMRQQQVEKADAGATSELEVLCDSNAPSHALDRLPLMEQQTWSSTVPTTASYTDGTRTVATNLSSNTSAESLLIDDIRIEDRTKVDGLNISRRDALVEALIDVDDTNFDSVSEDSDNTAEEEWSDGSSDALSDEVEDEDQWNDWGNERLTIEELELEAKEMSSPSLNLSEDEGSIDVPEFDDIESLDSQTVNLDDDVWTADNLNKVQISGFTVTKADLGIESASNSEAESSATSSLKSNYSLSHYSDSDEGSDLDVETAKHLDTLIFGQGSREGKQRVSLEVHNVNATDSTPSFHFAYHVTRSIFDSPPVFHPTKPLIVWPLGDAEILFADYKANTFFTRLLCCSRFRSCHIFIKAHFSSTGEYLHFAALEAQTEKPKEKEGKESLQLNLQVSTHRLSIRKTTRSPPRLLYRTTVNLGSVATLNVSQSPYTLQWTDQELYVTTRAETLQVMKIPLFLDASSGKSSVCHIQKEVYLPRTIEWRSLHFFPATSTLPLGSRHNSFEQRRDDDVKKAKIIIGSHSSIPSQNIVVPLYQVSPPIGVLLHNERDLGGWKCKAITAMAEDKERLNNAGGRLQGKFETFDQNEDCDIIPFLS